MYPREEMIKILEENIEEVKRKNDHGNRMYLLGLIMALQFDGDIRIINLIEEAHRFLNSTLPEVN